MNGLMLNDSTPMDLPKLIDTRLLVQANSGGGKSWLLRRILEQSHGKVQQIIIDLEGEFSTLREKYDYILAGKDGDTPAEPQSAALLARRLLELNVSAIVDLYELSHQDRKRFVRLFLSAMVNAPKNLWHPVIVVIDEAHVFAPQTGSSEAMEAVIDLATRGRKRGYCAVLATQRISKLHKDAVAEMNNKLIGRTGLDIDRKRAAEELGFTSKEDALSLRNLPPGEFYAFGPAISEHVTKISVGAVQTSHPKAGDRILTSTTPPTERIKAILSRLADLPQEAKREAQSLSELHSENTKLKRQVTLLQKQRPTEVETKTETIVMPDAKQAEALAKIITIAQGVIATAHPAGNAKAAVAVDKSLEAKNITGGAQRIMQVLGSRHPASFTKIQLAFMANMSPKSGTYSTYLSLLKTQNLIEGVSDISLTEKGIEYTASWDNKPQTQDEILDMWRGNLTGGARRMFVALVDRYPQSMSRAELADNTEMSVSSGTFSTYLSHLRRNSLVQTNGAEVMANKNLFLEAIQ